MGIHDVATVFEGFGWEVVQIDGNDYAQVQGAWHDAANKRVAVLAKTDKGCASCVPLRVILIGVDGCVG